MLKDIATRLVRQHGAMQLIPNWSSAFAANPPPRFVAASGIDVLILPESNANDVSLEAAYLAAHPLLRVISLSDDGRAARCYHRDDAGRIVEKLVEPLDIDQLVHAIRGARHAC